MRRHIRKKDVQPSRRITIDIPPSTSLPEKPQEDIIHSALMNIPEFSHLKDIDKCLIEESLVEMITKINKLY